MVFTPKKVLKGKLRNAQIGMIYGEGGIGKSTLASQFPSPLFLPTEDGTDQIDTRRVPLLASWDELKGYLIHYARNPVDDEGEKIETIVIDTVDRAEKLLHNWIVANKTTEKGKHVDDIEEFPWKAGYAMALGEWRVMFGLLETLKRAGVSTVLLGHSRVMTFKNPEGPDYEYHSPDLHEKIQAFTFGAVEYCLFAKKQVFLKEDKESRKKRQKAFGDGTRLLYTEGRPAFLAKNRHGMPFELPLEYGELSRYLFPTEASTKEEFDSAVAELTAVAEGTRYVDWAEKSVAKAAGDARKIVVAKNSLVARIEKERELQQTQEGAKE